LSSTRHRSSWLPAAAALLALLSALACDESKQLSEGERRIVVGAVSSNICPLPDADSTVNVQATVYGLDGSVAAGVDVTMTTTDGLFPNGTQLETIKTGDAGIVNIVLTTRRPPDDQIVVTGTLKDGKDDSVTINAPPNARVTLITANDTVTVGDSITVLVPTTGLCQARQALLEVSYDPAIAKFVTTAEGGIFNDPDSAGAPTSTDLYVVDAPRGTLRVNYARTDRPTTGVTSSGTLFGMLFEAIAPGDPQIYIRSVTFLPVDGRPLTTVNQADTPDSMQITVNPATTAAAR
jgi:hypothetical protein